MFLAWVAVSCEIAWFAASSRVWMKPASSSPTVADAGDVVAVNHLRGRAGLAQLQQAEDADPERDQSRDTDRGEDFRLHAEVGEETPLGGRRGDRRGAHDTSPWLMTRQSTAPRVRLLPSGHNESGRGKP